MSMHASPITPGHDEYPLGAAEMEQYRRDCHILLRSVASPSTIGTYRPYIREVVDEKARQNDSQGRASYHFRSKSPIFPEDPFPPRTQNQTSDDTPRTLACTFRQGTARSSSDRLLGDR